VDNNDMLFPISLDFIARGFSTRTQKIVFPPGTRFIYYMQESFTFNSVNSATGGGAVVNSPAAHL
jgi:hypothetical protein